MPMPMAMVVVYIGLRVRVGVGVGVERNLAGFDEAGVGELGEDHLCAVCGEVSHC